MAMPYRQLPGYSLPGAMPAAVASWRRNGALTWRSASATEKLAKA